ncbi:MAG TPA: hypothetical protein VGR37_05785 [Longimicrobiaceae bacterium]|nr:hypothetical protein [Longimicrobiaceae bacterium]
MFDLQSGEVTCWMEGGFLALKPLSSGQLTAEVDWQAFSRRFSPEQAIQGRRYPGVHYCESREHGSGALKGNLWHSPYFPHELTGTSTRDSVYLSGSLSKPARRVTLRGFRQGDHIAGEIEISTSSEEGQRWRGRFAATKGPPVREEERHWWKFPAPFIVSPR